MIENRYYLNAMSVVGSLLINGSAGQKLGVTGEGRWKVLGRF